MEERNDERLSEIRWMRSSTHALGPTSSCNTVCDRDYHTQLIHVLSREMCEQHNRVCDMRQEQSKWTRSTQCANRDDDFASLQNIAVDVSDPVEHQPGSLSHVDAENYIPFCKFSYLFSLGRMHKPSYEHEPTPFKYDQTESMRGSVLLCDNRVRWMNVSKDSLFLFLSQSLGIVVQMSLQSHSGRAWMNMLPFPTFARSFHHHHQTTRHSSFCHLVSPLFSCCDRFVCLYDICTLFWHLRTTASYSLSKQHNDDRMHFVTLFIMLFESISSHRRTW